MDNKFLLWTYTKKRKIGSLGLWIQHMDLIARTVSAETQIMFNSNDFFYFQLRTSRGHKLFNWLISLFAAS